MLVRARRVVLLANPAAGLRRGRDVAEAVRRAVAPHARTVEVVRTRGPGDAKTLAADAARLGSDLVLAIGGDGTAHEAANGLVGTSTVLGVAPAGTMNLLARVLGLPLDAVRAAELVVRAGRVIEVRPGRAGERHFLLMAGIGFDAFVLNRLLAAGAKIRLRDYALGAMGTVLRYGFPSVALEADGIAMTGHTAIVGRSALYGGFLRPTPDASLLREELDLCLFSGTRVTMVRAIPALWSGGHVGREGVVSGAFRRVDARSTDGTVPMQLDGEPAGFLPTTLDVADATLRLAH